MKLIPLSQQGKYKGKYFAMVDDTDYDWLIKYRWSIFKNGDYFYASGKINRKTIYLHRFIMGVTNPKILVDHADRNTLNFQRHNLRIATKSQNMANSKSSGSSKYLGVCYFPNIQKYTLKDGTVKIYSYPRWIATICKNRKQTYLGVFKTEEKAALRYNEEAIKLHGEFANLNKI